jgi:hypothetical protein
MIIFYHFTYDKLHNVFIKLYSEFKSFSLKIIALEKIIFFHFQKKLIC